jgi:hypothetical protein
MSNVIQFSITGDTNAEQVAGRAKTAVSGLDKQMDGIGKKFGSGFKDIFLSFLGPMALLSAAMAFIGKMISDNQKKHEDANKAAIEGTNALMSAEDKYWANKRNNENKAKETDEEAVTAREDVTKSFLQNDPRGKEMVNKILDTLPPGMRAAAAFNTAGSMSKQKEIQDQVQAMIAEDMKNNPLAAVAGKDSTFQGPQGFSNVIGVGSNPILENMTRQTDIQQQILEYIKAQVPNVGRLDVPDFTKRVPLTLQKSGLT